MFLDYGHNKPQVALQRLVQDSTTKHAAVMFVIFVSCIVFVIQKMRKVHRRLRLVLSGPDRTNHAVLQCGRKTYATFSPSSKGDRPSSGGLCYDDNVFKILMV